jgi:hypothetical protein
LGEKLIHYLNWLKIKSTQQDAFSILRTTLAKLSTFLIRTSGVWISFSRHSPNWRVVKNFHSPSQKTIGSIYKNWEKKTRQAGVSGFAFLLAEPEFYSHLANWRVVIRTPAHMLYRDCRNDIDMGRSRLDTSFSLLCELKVTFFYPGPLT